MKKNIIFIILVLFIFGVTGCKNSGMPIDSSLNVEHETSKDNIEEKMVNAWLTGSFTVTVRELLPDYVFDGTTICCAVVTYFQDGPFIMYIGEEASELEVGEQYTFTIKNQPIGEVSMNDIGKEITYLEAQVNYQRVNIASFRKATGNELGLGGSNIKIVEVE